MAITLSVCSPCSGTTNTISGVTITGGLATNNAHGAGISNAGVLTLIDSAVVNNHTVAGLGGGIYNSADLTILGSLVESNTVSGGDGNGGGTGSYAGAGGGFGGGGGGLGGGLFTRSGAVVVSNSSFIANQAVGGNGGRLEGGDNSGANGGGPNGGSGGGPDGNGNQGGFGGGGGGGGTATGSNPGGNGGNGGFGGGGGGGGTVGGSRFTVGGVGGFGGGNGSAGGPRSLIAYAGSAGGGGGLGGGIFVDSGRVALRRVRLAENQAIGGTAGGKTFSGDGGCGFGGGLFEKTGTLELRECWIAFNRAGAGVGTSASDAGRGGQGGGGGMYLLDTTATLAESTIANNQVVGGLSPGSIRFAQPGGDGNGGGLLLDNSNVAITNCTFSANHVTGGQGGYSGLIGALSGGAALGGGILVRSGAATAVNCTLFTNGVTGGQGGNLLGFVGPTGEAHGGGFANQSGSLSIFNTLVSANTATTNSTASDGFGSMTSQGHNLLGTTNEITGVAASDLQNVGPNLGPLQNNGGFAPTHALLLNSPAVDAGGSAGAPPTDERDVPRPQGVGVDIGAFELSRVSILLDGRHVLSGPVTNLASVEVTLQSTFANATVLYTLDGSTPSFESTLYTGPLTVTNSVVIRVIAYSADFAESSQADPVQIVIVPIYSLTLTTVGQGLVVSDPSPGPYPSHSIVMLRAVPATNWDFLRWTGDATGASPALQITMDRDKHVQAEFSEAQVYTLTVEIQGSGSVTLNPPGGSYPSNTLVTLAASASPGWVFDDWTGDAAGTNATVNTAMDRNKQVTARFVPVYSLSLGTVGGGTFMVTPSTEQYVSNSVVTVTAAPANGWSFMYWLGDASGTNSTVTVSMTADRCIRGVFGTSLGVTVAGNGTVQISHLCRCILTGVVSG